MVNWLTGWGRRKSQVISQEIGAGTNYQMCIKVYKTSGTDQDETIKGITARAIYLGSNVRDDFGDIRFTSSDGETLLDHWMENVTSTSWAIFWVEVSGDLDAGDVTIYVYYDKSDATTVNDEETTALSGYADDYESSNSFINSLGNGITVDTTTSLSTSHSLKCVTGASTTYAKHLPAVTLPNLDTISIFNSLHIVAGRTAGNNHIFAFRNSGDTAWIGPHVFITAAFNLYWNDGSGHDSGYNIPADTWTEFECRINFATNTFNVYADGVLVITGASFINAMAKNASVIINATTRHASANSVSYEDNYFMRKYFATEPSWGSTGSEETPPAEGLEAGFSLIPILQGIGILK